MVAPTNWYTDTRFGLFIHYGLYSMLGRGEWVMNRERIPRDEYRRLAQTFTARDFDAEAICDLAVEAGMEYVTLTTMHHDGFRLYPTDITPFNSVQAPNCGRDLTGEIVAACRARGLRVCLYHSLNQWMDLPDACDALEDQTKYNGFIDHTFARIRDLVTRYNPIDTLWYDGWWPFNAKGWQAERMNAMVRDIQPHILFNNRNCLPGDITTPEGHVTAPTPWRPWEACITLNNHWGWHRGDHDWKHPADVIDMLATVANGNGNLLLNIGPEPDGAVPAPCVDILRRVGAWVKVNREAIWGTDIANVGLQHREPTDRADWYGHGKLTLSGNAAYLIVRNWPGRDWNPCGFQVPVRKVEILGCPDLVIGFRQEGDRLFLDNLPETPPTDLCPVVKITCDGPASIRLGGGFRVPTVPHPPYDPVTSDLEGY